MNKNRFRDKRTYSRPRHDNHELRKRNIFFKIFKKFVGACLVLFTIFALVAFTSYIFTHQVDQPAAESFLRYSWNSPILVAENVAGISGAVLSYVFVYEYLGIVASFLILLPMFITGIRFLGLRFFKSINLAKLWSFTLWLIFFVELCLGIFVPMNLFSSFSGFLPYNLAAILKHYFGWGIYVVVISLMAFGLKLFMKEKEEKTENA